jgi:hypothetical protein
MKIVRAREIIAAWDEETEPELTATEDEALDVVEAAGYSCPTCGAEPDEECQGKTTHKRRIRKIARYDGYRPGSVWSISAGAPDSNRRRH